MSDTRSEAKFLVSVIVPTCNRPALLREALASIRALEGPDLGFEIIVGDNGLTDESSRHAAEFGAIHVTVERRGAGAARNAALRKASAPFIAFLDDDDVWLPGHVRPQLLRLKEDPNLGIVFGQIVTTDLDRVPTSDPWPSSLPAKREDLLRMMLSGYFPQLGGTVARTRILEDVGDFDEALLGDQDWDWHLKAVEKHEAGFVETPCALFRQRADGTFDDLIARRIRFTRWVFARHAIRLPRFWAEPKALVRMYHGTMQGYFDALVASTIRHAAHGDKRAARRAALLAVGTIPHRAIRDFFRPTAFRAALVGAADRSVLVPKGSR